MFIDVQELSHRYQARKVDPNRHWLKELLRANYQWNPVFASLSFSVSEPAITALLGKNGSGKTTLIKILCGILTPTSGHVSVLGFEPGRREKLFLKGLGVVFGQKKMLWPELTLLENFEITSALYDVPPFIAHQRSHRLIEQFDLAGLISRPVKTYSLGESMRAELANILLYEPKALFLDEPTIGMDISSQAKFRAMIRSYAAEHRCHVLLTSHNLKDVTSLANRILFLENGKIEPIPMENSCGEFFEKQIEKRLMAA